MVKETGPIGKLDPSKKIHIIGAGISGLLMGYYLKKAGKDFLLFEQNRIGGKIATTQTPSGPAEQAANAVFTNSDVLELLDDLQLSYIPSRKPLKRLVWRGNRTMAFPLRPLEALRAFFGLFKRIPSDLEKLSVYDFFRPMLGEKVAFEVLSAALGGIYASNSKELRFKSVFRAPVQAKRYIGYLKGLAAARKSSGHRPTSVGFASGMAEFVDALRASIQEHIVMERKSSIDPDVNTIICADAKDAAILLEEADPKLARELAKVPYRALATSTYFLRRPVLKLEGAFGALFAPAKGRNCLGVLHNSDIFPGRTSSDQLRSYTFISRDRALTKEEAFGLLNLLEGEERFNPAQAPLQDSLATSWERGIPIYNHERSQAIQKLRILMAGRNPGLALFGNYVDGISIREMVSQAKKFASSL